MNKYTADELFKIAYGHLKKKEFEKSSQLFEKLLKDFPDNLSILVNISHSYAFSGAFKKAEECIKKIIKIKPDEPFAYQFLASVLKNQDKIEEMIKIVNKGLKKKLINEKWEIQKNLEIPQINMFPMFVYYLFPITSRCHAPPDNKCAISHTEQ